MATNATLTFPANSCVRVSFPGGGRPSDVGAVEVACLILASTSSLLGRVDGAADVAAVLGLSGDAYPDEGPGENEPPLGDAGSVCVPSGLLDMPESCKEK